MCPIVLPRAALALLLLPLLGLAPAGTSDQSPTRMLLVDPGHTPRVEITWANRDGDITTYAGQRPYGADASREHLGGNIDAFVAVGGTRLTKGAGHPRGSIVRIGFYKDNKNKPWFPDITRNTEITVTVSGVRFNQPATIHPRSVIQHLKYDRGDMESCGIPGDAREQFNTADPDDTLNDRVRPGVDARLGVFTVAESPGHTPQDDETDREETAKEKPGDEQASGEEPGDKDQHTEPADTLGAVRVTRADDGSASVTLTYRYPALRNQRDPWKSDLPGTFLEPIHFHVEFEALPQGVEPLDPTRDRVSHPTAAD